MVNQRFVGKVALVTGATSGIGQATALRLAEDGAVVAVNRRPKGDARTTLTMIDEAGGDAFEVIADMRDPAGVVDMVDTVVKTAGRIDYLVSNAAINPQLAWNETTLEDYDRIQETNLRGTWLVAQAAAKAMISAGTPGAIVAVSSISAWVGAAEQVVYCGTKAGISMLMKALAVVLGPHGIRCNAVLPGAILTPMSMDLLDPDSTARQYYVERTPLRRIGEPREVANAIAYLLSDEASFVNSSELLVDGGFIVNAE